MRKVYKLYIVMALFLISTQSCQYFTGGDIGVGNRTKDANLFDNELVNGSIAYNYQNEMIMNEVYTFDVVIACNVDKAKLVDKIASFKDTSDLLVDSIKMGEYMRVKLIDPTESNFKITELSTGKQKINLDENSKYENRWQWDIIPLKKDSLPLRVKVWASYYDEEFDIPVYNAIIHVVPEKKPLNWGLILPIGIVGLLALSYVVYIFLLRRKLKYSLETEKLNDIQELISKGNTKSALEQLSKIIPAADISTRKKLTTLSARLAKIESEKTMNIISYDRYDLELSKIRERILNLLGRLGG